jgi:hypothetical protein
MTTWIAISFRKSRPYADERKPEGGDLLDAALLRQTAQNRGDRTNAPG